MKIKRMKHMAEEAAIKNGITSGLIGKPLKGKTMIKTFILQTCKNGFMLRHGTVGPESLENISVFETKESLLAYLGDTLDK